VQRIFDGEKEAKLIALTCSKPPKGRARWTLRLLEEKVVELQIVNRASDSTIGRTLKKTFASRIGDSAGLSRPISTYSTADALHLHSVFGSIRERGSSVVRFAMQHLAYLTSA
jgi:hypothetical protein